MLANGNLELLPKKGSEISVFGRCPPGSKKLQNRTREIDGVDSPIESNSFSSTSCGGTPVLAAVREPSSAMHSSRSPVKPLAQADLPNVQNVSEIVGNGVNPKNETAS